MSRVVFSAAPAAYSPRRASTDRRHHDSTDDFDVNPEKIVCYVSRRARRPPASAPRALLNARARSRPAPSPGSNRFVASGAVVVARFRAARALSPRPPARRNRNGAPSPPAPPAPSPPPPRSRSRSPANPTVAVPAASPRAVHVHAGDAVGSTLGSFLSVNVHTLSTPSPLGSTATHLDATRQSAVAMGVGS